MSTLALPALTINTDYADRLPDGRVLALKIPGGSWVISVYPTSSGWVAVADPRGHDGEPFTIASGSDKTLVRNAGMQWWSTAVVTAPTSRFVYRGITNRAPGTMTSIDA